MKTSRKKNKTGKDAGKKNNHPAMAGWKLKAWYAFLFTMFSFLIDQSNLFGISDVVKQHNELIYQRLTAGFYGNDPEQAQEKLAVMLYTDKVAQLKHMGWPMRFVDFGEMISLIRDADAQGVFIDIVFRSVEHDRDGFCGFFETITDITGLSYSGHQNLDDCLDISDQLIAMVADQGVISNGIQSEWPKREAKLGRIARKKKIPVIVGASREYLDARQDYFNCLSHSGQCVIQREGEEISVFEAFQGEIEEWPVTALLDQVAILAPISIGAENGRSVHLSVGKKEHLSPAWLIARQVAYQTPEKKELADEYKFLSELPPSDRNLYLKWGGVVSREQNTAIPLNRFDGCVQRERIWARMIKLLVAQTFPESASVIDLIARCPFHLTIDMYNPFNLVSMDHMSEEFKTNTSSKFDLRVLNKLLKDRFVLVGLAMNRFSDHTESPVHGTIAGVYTHAMAVDNLLEYKEKYYFTHPKEPRKLFGANWKLLMFQFGFTLMLAFLMLIGFTDIKARVYRKKANKRWTQAGVLIMLGAFIFLFTELTIGMLSEGSDFLDYGLILVLAFAISYTLVFYPGKFVLTSLKSILNKPARRKVNAWISWISIRDDGLCQCMPHVVIILLVFIFLISTATIISFFCRFDPFNFLYTFLSFLSLYLVFASSEITNGIATFIMNKDVAGEFFN